MVHERKIYEDEGVEKYVAYQLEHENEPLKPGAAFPFVKVGPLRSGVWSLKYEPVIGHTRGKTPCRDRYREIGRSNTKLPLVEGPMRKKPQHKMLRVKSASHRRNLMMFKDGHLPLVGFSSRYAVTQDRCLKKTTKKKGA